MISAIFVCERHDDYGTLGLRMKGRPHFDPLPGMAVAHDLMEHFPRDDGLLSGELMALGASIRVRDEDNYYCQKGQTRSRAAENIASDMPQQVWYTRARGETSLLDPGNTRPLTDWAEAVVQDVLKESVRLLRSEVEPEDFPGWLKGDEQRRRFVGWLRRGYRAAVHRYHGIAASFLMSTFMEVEREVDDYLKHAEAEGAEVRVSVDVRRSRVFLTEQASRHGY